MSQRHAATVLSIVGALALAGCATSAPAPEDVATQPAATAPADASPSPTPDAERYTLQDDGIGVCFALVAEQLGTDIAVLELDSAFAGGEALDDALIATDDPAEAGDLESCVVQYQDPQDANALIQSSFDVDAGAFDAPVPVELTVSGNAGDFVLADHVLPIGQIDAAAVTGTIAPYAAQLDASFTEWAWTSLHLEMPDAFGSGFVLFARGDGLHVTNGMDGSMGVRLATDGVAVVQELFVN